VTAPLLGAALDVDYAADGSARAALVAFSDWTDAAPALTRVVTVDRVAPYEPGAFYKRELPCLRAVLDALDALPAVLVVDGYVWLRDDADPGLGAHLWHALGGRCAVVGVAKTRFASAGCAAAVLRGQSHNPLWVTAAGMSLDEAAARVRAMHGPYRIPTLLGRVDALARGRG
jgi:deoxyribonuclease V